MDASSALREDNAAAVSHLILEAGIINTGLLVATHLPLLTSCPPPLSIACFFNAADCFSLLLAHGANVNKPDLQGVSSMHIGFRSTLPPHPAMFTSLRF
jgi:hypothetical protein